MNKFLNSFSGISVNNMQAAKDFYVEILGLELTEQNMGLHLNLPGGGSLFIYEKTDHVPATFTVLNFVVEDINSVIDELVGKGITFERYDTLPAEQDERGVLRGKAANQGPDIAWFEDPSGNVISLVEE